MSVRDIRRALTFTSGGRRLVTSCLIRVEPRVVLKTSTQPFADPSIFLRSGTALIRSANLAMMMFNDPKGCMVCTVSLEGGDHYCLKPLLYRFFTYLVIHERFAILDLVPKAPTVELASEVPPTVPYASAIECPCERPAEQGCLTQCTIKVSQYLFDKIVTTEDYLSYLKRMAPHPAAVAAASWVGSNSIIHIVFENDDIRTLLYDLMSFFSEFEMDPLTTMDRRVSEAVDWTLRQSYQELLTKDIDHLLRVYSELSRLSEIADSKGENEVAEDASGRD